MRLLDLAWKILNNERGDIPLFGAPIPDIMPQDAITYEARVYTRDWLQLDAIPSERFTRGLIQTLGRCIVTAGGKGLLTGKGVVGLGAIFSTTLETAISTYVREYIRKIGSIDQ